MNARSVSAILLALVVCGNVFAETENNEEAEPEVASQFAAADVSPGALARPVDFRPIRVTDGKFDAPSSAAFNAFGAGMFIAAGADFASTEYGLGRAGVYEVNPVQGNRNIRILTHTAVPAFMYYVTDKLHDRGKHKLALLARIGFTVGYSYVVMHNLRTASVAP